MKSDFDFEEPTSPDVYLPIGSSADLQRARNQAAQLPLCSGAVTRGIGRRVRRSCDDTQPIELRTLEQELEVYRRSTMSQP